MKNLLLIALLSVALSQTVTRPTYVCGNGFFWNSQLCAPCMTVANGYCTCSTQGTCTTLTCNPTYIPNTANTACTACGNGCSSCSMDSTNTRSVCTGCQTGYQMINGICVSSANCLTLDSVTGICTQCSTGYFFNWNFNPTVPTSFTEQTYYQYYPTFCSACMSRCSVCSTSDTCQTCSTGYYLTVSQGQITCSTCPITNCSSCTTAGVCTSCSNGFYLQATTSSAICTSCPAANCLSCNSSVCLQCAIGFTMTGRNQCTSCPSTLNCQICNSNGTCQLCNTGYTPNILGVCYQCPTNCANCSINQAGNAATCTACNDQYYLLSGTSTTNASCQPCNSSSGSSGQSQWLRCAGPNDTPSMTQLQPTQCQSGYYLVVVNGVNTCQQGTLANSCYTLQTNSTSNCAQCNAGFYLSASNICTQCPTGCTSCALSSGTLACSAVSSGYYLNGSTVASCQPNCTSCNSTTCNICATGYVVNSTNNNLCTQCSAGCSVCTSSSSCSTCLSGYNLISSSNTCQQCPSNCSACSNTYLCSTCNLGYVLNAGSCVTLSQANCMTAGATGCTQCMYGFYLGTVTVQSGTTTSTASACLQCIQPFAGFVCGTTNTAASTTRRVLQTAVISPAPTTTTPTTTSTTTTYSTVGIAGVQSTRVTQLCSNGYFWAGQSCFQCQSISNGYCSCSALGGCTTVTCNTGYASSGGNNCNLQCDPGCANCTTGQGAVICSSCNSGYSMLGNVCVKNQGCQTFSATTGVCTSCQQGYYLNINLIQTSFNSGQFYFQNLPSFCSLCTLQNCSNCSSSTTCATCNQGYYWVPALAGGSCQTCTTACISCTSSGICQTCANGYYLVPITAGSAATSPTCATCGSNCSICTSGTACTTCATGYQLYQGTCYQCPANCSQCAFVNTTSSQLTCNACQDTYYLVASNSIQTCTSCSSTNNQWVRCAGTLDSPSQTTLQATQCVAGFFLATVSGVNSCVQYQTPNTCLTISTTTTPNSQICQTCLSPYQLTSPGTCQLCSISNCSSCSVNTGTNASTIPFLCSTCSSGYYYVTASNTCAQCTGGCQTCSATACTTCLSGYMLASGSCTPCGTGCISCSDADICTQCQAGYYQFTQTSGTTVISQACYSCPQGCNTCDPEGQYCLSCLTGYLLNNQGCTNIANDFCYQPGANGCTTCDYGFYLLDGACYECINPYAGTVCRQVSTNTTTNGSTTTNGTTNGTTNTNNTSPGTNPTVNLVNIDMIQQQFYQILLQKKNKKQFLLKLFQQTNNNQKKIKMVQEIFQGLFCITLLALFIQHYASSGNQEQQQQQEEPIPPPPRNIIKKQSYKDLPSTPDIKMKLSQKNKKEMVIIDENEPSIKKLVKMQRVESVEITDDEKKEETEEDVTEEQENQLPKTPIFAVAKGSIEYVTTGRINLTASEPTKRKLWDDDDQI
ncbi:hypothetical protein pb186bvf_004202 [Paramecium bursaria]